MINLIKEIAVAAVNATNPVSFFYGTILSTSPLQVKISDNLILTKEFLLVPKSLTDYKVNVKMNWSTENKTLNTAHTHEVNYTDDTINGSSNKKVVSEEGRFNSTHNHSITGTKELMIFNALKINDKVILVKVQGGQEYIILDKVG